MNQAAHLIRDLTGKDLKQAPIREGFGKGLLEAGKKDSQIVALCADLTESTRMNLFAEEFPGRFVEVGVAEQNLVTVATGLSAMGKIPFASSYAAFSPGRNWEQIRTTICLNERNVKIVGSHAGISVGPDGATHQMLEDIALMRALPNMIVVAPGDSVEAEKATLALAKDERAAYLRLGREKTPIFTTDKTPFSLNKMLLLKSGSDITLIGTGTMTYHLLVAAEKLEKDGVSAEVLHCPVIKPFDGATLLASVAKTGIALTAEEAQIKGGLGGAVTEFLAEHHPAFVKRIGIDDRFGESGDPNVLMEHFGLTGPQIAETVKKFMKAKS